MTTRRERAAVAVLGVCFNTAWQESSGHSETICRSYKNAITTHEGAKCRADWFRRVENTVLAKLGPTSPTP